jgi:CBS domain containing-hemolysin-like protein
MVPRADVHAVPDDISLTELLLAFTRSAHSRMPVYRETLDDANAMVHIRDLMEHITTDAYVEGGSLDLTRVDLSAKLADSGLMRSVLSVPGTMPATDLLARMRAARIQMALVIDEYGGVDGLVSMEDIVEAVVGDIEDEHDAEDEDAPSVVQLGRGAWSIDGLTELEEVTEVTGVDFGPLLDEEEEIETLGGVVFALHGQVPPVGEVLTSDNLPDVTFEVLEADSRRVRRVALRRVEGERGEP